MQIDPKAWPPYVFLPIKLWIEVLLHTTIKANGDPVSFEDIKWIADEMAACGTWRITKDVVRFDADLYYSLLDTPLEGNIPCSVLRRLPAWCIFIETPGARLHGEDICGFWVRTGHSEKRKKDSIAFNFLKADISQSVYGDHTIPAVLPLDNLPVKEVLSNLLDGSAAIGTAHKNWRNLGGMEYLDFVARHINLVLYLCAYGFPGSGGNGTEAPIQRPQPKKTKKGWRLFAADKVTIRHIGKEVGESIRRAREAEDTTTVKRASMRPHVRRGHWHGYWHGPKKDKDGAPLQQKYKLNWLPPMAVALRDDEEVETAETA